MGKDTVAAGEVFAARVKEIRKARGWTQVDLARRVLRLHDQAETEGAMHTWRVAVSRTESGARKATIENLLLFSAALGVSPVALLVPSGGAYLTVGQRNLAPLVVQAWVSGVLPLARDDDVETWDRFSRRSNAFAAVAELQEVFTELTESPRPITDDTREAFLAYIEAEEKLDARSRDTWRMLPADLGEQVRQAGEMLRGLRVEAEAAIKELPREEDERKPQQGGE